jgi:hypothetical protein
MFQDNLDIKTLTGPIMQQYKRTHQDETVWNRFDVGYLRSINYKIILIK